MSVRFYMDVHVRRAVTVGLRSRGVDVLTAQDDGAARLPDEELLDRSMELGRVLFTQDDDLLRLAAARQRTGVPFSGVIYAHQQGPSIGQLIADLEIIAESSEPEELANHVEYLPL